MSYKRNSLLIHGGIDGDETTGAVNVPVYQTSTYKQDGLGKNRGWEYSRTGNPTRAALEKLIADLEEGQYGLAFASGLAAINTVLSLFKAGDKLIVSDNIYGGTFRILDNVFKNFNITYKIVDTSDLEAVENAIDDDVKAIYIETPANPLLTITDIEAVSAIGRKAPKHVKKLDVIWTDDGPVLCWTAPKYKDEMNRPVKYVVYRFVKSEKVDLNDATKIMGFTTQPFFPLTYEGGKVKYNYVVTALDRLHNESKPKKEKIKL